ncbi:MAG: sugar kinase [Deltaproteobacteria bacterium]|nr:sugar kinase [Deltaproteobacteria bacterium]
MEKHGYDIFGLGQSSLDYIGTVGDFPRADEKCEFSRLTVEGGGPVATALVALSRWGLRCYFCGVVGDDSFGDIITSSLTTEGIDTGGVVTRRTSESQFAFIACEPGQGRRTIFWRRPTGPPLHSEEIDYRAIGRSKIFHTDGLFIEAALRASAYARGKGIPVTVDGGTLREGMLDLARLSDYFIASETFAAALAGHDDPEGACHRILELGPRVAAVTLGSRGCVAVYNGTVIKQPAYPVAAVDTTGCGDVFHGGFIYGLTRNWDMKKCFDCAAWAAAQVSLRIGGRDGIPTLTEMRRHGY